MDKQEILKNVNELEISLEVLSKLNYNKDRELIDSAFIIIQNKFELLKNELSIITNKSWNELLNDNTLNTVKFLEDKFKIKIIEL